MSMAESDGHELARFALLIDGENLSAQFATAILRIAGTGRELAIRRVYGNATMLNGWSDVSGLRIVHSGSGKNATDLLICIEAMEIFHTRQAQGIVLAASDRDYSHLALHLRERGFPVVGIGGLFSSEKLRSCFGEFVLLAGPVQEAAPVKLTLKKAVEKIVRNSAERQITFSQLGQELKKCNFGKADSECATWLKYFDQNKEFLVEGSGPSMTVRMR